MNITHTAVVQNSPVISPEFPDIDKLNISKVNSHLSQLAEKGGFPVSVFPEKVREIVEATNTYLGFPKDFIAASLLHAASTAIGNTRLCKMNWNERGLLYMVLVGNPGVNKSHPMKWAYDPLSEQDKECYKAYKDELKSFEIANAAYLKNKKDESDPPQKPILKKRIVADCTIEALVRVLEDNPRGICSYNDELAGWLNNMTRYSSGSDLPQWLSMWSDQAIVVDRQSRPSVRVDHPFVNVIGGIQPAVLSELNKDNKSKTGLTDRILFVVPKGLKRPAWSDLVIDDNVRLQWGHIVNQLLKLDFARNDFGDLMPVVLEYTPTAKELVKAWQIENIKEDESEQCEVTDSISAKMEAYVHRFALVLQLLRGACGESGNETIDVDSVGGAIEIVKYFKRTALEVSTILHDKNPVDLLPLKKRKVYDALPDSFTTAEGLCIAKSMDVIEKTFKNWLNDRKLFEKTEHGKYQKLY